MENKKPPLGNVTAVLEMPAGGGDAACLILIGYRMSFAQWPCTGISTKLWTVPSLNNPLPIISPRLLTAVANSGIQVPVGASRKECG